MKKRKTNKWSSFTGEEISVLSIGLRNFGSSLKNDIEKMAFSLGLEATEEGKKRGSITYCKDE